MKVKYYGHSCFSIHTSGKALLFDPFISENPLAKDLDINSIEADYIFLSHAHHDHTADAIAIAERTGAKIIGIWEISEWAKRQGHENTHPMNIGGFFTFDFGTVQMVKAEHSSSFPDGSYAGNAAGFVVKSSEASFYYAGDTALTIDMQLIPLYSKLDFAFLPIGDNFTMGIKDAARAAKLVQCKKVVGMHFDTFLPIEINHSEALDHFESEQLQLTLPLINQTFQL